MPALTAPLLLIFLSNLFIAFKVKWITNSSKLSLDKETATFVSAFFLKLPGQESKDIVKNDSCYNSSSSKLFLLDLNIFPDLFFAPDFHLFSFKFVSLTLAS